MEIFFLLLKGGEDLTKVTDAMGEFGKIIESLLFVVPMLENNTFEESFMAVITVELVDNKVDRLRKDKRINEMTRWVFYIEQKSYMLFDVLREVSFRKEDYYALKREDNGGRSIRDYFEKNLGTEEVLIKWGKLIYFNMKTEFNDDMVESLIRFWINLIETGPEIFMRLPKEPEPFEDEEIGLYSSLFPMKQKFLYWMIKRRTTNDQKLELLSEFYSRLEVNLNFINEDSKILVQFSKFVFARFLASRNVGSFTIQLFVIREKVRCLEMCLSARIWIGHTLDNSIFDSQALKKPLEREKWDNYIQRVFKESLDSFIMKTEETLEYLSNENQKFKRSSSEAYLRLNHVSFMLAFNANTKFQGKINSNIKSLKAMSLKLPFIKRSVFAVELEHFSQLKNYNRIAVLLSKLKAFESVDIKDLVPNFWQRLPDKNMIIDEIDPLIISIRDFSLKKYEFTNNGLEICVSLEYTTDIKDFELRSVRLTLGTGDPESPSIEAMELPILKLSENGGKFEMIFVYPPHLHGVVSFLVIQSIQFKFYDISFCLRDFNEILNKNIDLDSLPCMCINTSGFVNRLSSEIIFFEENGPNYFFVDFSAFDNRNSNLSNLKLDIQKSSKYLILNPKMKLLTKSESIDLVSEFERILMPIIPAGRYVLVLTLYLLHSKMKNYKLKLSFQIREKSFSHVINLKGKHECFYHLENHLQYVSDEYSQLKLRNKNPGTISIYKINSKECNPSRILGFNEELSTIVKSQEDTSVVYELVGQTFLSQPIHQIISQHAPELVITGSRIFGRILRIEQFILNKDLNIKSLEIKNKKEVKIFEQNHFILHYKFDGSKEVDSKGSENQQVKKIYLELKWNREKYCIIGKNRFLLRSNTREKRKEVAFIPFESGFLAYPQILLVETKDDGSEIQHLLDEHMHAKIFFVYENVTKIAQIESKLNR
jgi:hypothetical protein